MTTMDTFPDRFLDKVSPEPNTGCWLWTASVTTDGYGRYKSSTGNRASRFAYETAKAPIPDGLVIDHLCRVRCCVNPDHLDAVTRAENDRRGLHGILRPSSCRHGHEFTSGNTHINPSGARVCRACATIATRRKPDGPPASPREFCLRGHSVSDNPIVQKSGKRQCRVCNNARQLARYHARKTIGA